MTMTMQYKVVTQRDRGFTGKVKPEAVEETLNALAMEGWRLVSATTGSLNNSYEELIMILEREV
jgi:hypothetical protein